MNLVVVGTVAFDAIETPHGKTNKIIGGAATYISLAASYLSRQIGIVSAVGDDFPDDYINLLNTHNIDTSGLAKIAGEKSFFWSGRYSADMNSRETIKTELNVLEKFSPKVPPKFRNCRVVMLGNLAPALQISAIEQLENRPELIILDSMNYWIENTLSDLKRALTMVDILTINDSEARQLSGEHSLPAAAKMILKMGPRYLIIKKGEHGALLFSNDEIFAAPALPIENVFDPTGAGDSFAGGLTGYLASRENFTFETLKSAVIVGSAMASFCVEKFGTENLVSLQLSDIQKRVNRFNDLTKFNSITL